MFNRQILILVMVVSAVISPFLFYSSSRTPWVSSKGLIPNATMWQELIYPIEYLTHLAASTVRQGWRDYIDLSKVSQENRSLRSRLAAQQVRIMDYQHQASETRRLKKLLGFYQQKKFPLTAAEVIGSYNNNRFRSLRITRGTLDSISVGMPVIAADGIVGRIIRTGLKYSDVQLLEDSNFHLDVLLERTRVRGVLQGISNNLCRLQLHKRADVRIGDTLITSGLVSGFPKGLRVGIVTRIRYESDNISQLITVEPWVDFHQQEEVLIINTSDQEIRKIKETAGLNWMSKTIGKIRNY